MMEEVGMMNNFKKFPSKEQLTDELASHIALILQEAIDEKGKTSILLSGGNTPKEFFKKLSTFDIPWESVYIGLVDERWVPKEHKDSNELLVKEYLMQNNASKANFVGMYINDKEPNECEIVCSDNYKKMLYPFDLVVLGMGADSHTASLFPNNKKLKEAYDLENNSLCIAITPNDAPHKRMSLTLGAILSAKNIILHIEGKEKLKVYEEASKSNDILKNPISAVLNNTDSEVEVYYA
ncbi:6-phosphogluconolactonase [Halarcobacter ebronensis]|nr:6-phosphogluconolactonase [Halarcobacter ebronensis]